MNMNTDGIATSAESIKAKVKEYILKEFLPGENPESIGGSTELIDSGILDSLATLKLVSFITLFPGLFLIWGGKAFAAMDGRYSVSLEDVRRAAVPVMRHRLACNFAAQAEGLDSVKIVQRLLEAVPEPEIPKREPTPPRESQGVESLEG